MILAPSFSLAEMHQRKKNQCLVCSTNHATKTDRWKEVGLLYFGPNSRRTEGPLLVFFIKKKKVEEITVAAALVSKIRGKMKMVLQLSFEKSKKESGRIYLICFSSLFFENQQKR